MWRFMNASVIGTSHQDNQTECQDNHYVEPGQSRYEFMLKGLQISLKSINEYAFG